MLNVLFFTYYHIPNYNTIYYVIIFYIIFTYFFYYPLWKLKPLLILVFADTLTTKTYTFKNGDCLFYHVQEKPIT